MRRLLFTALAGLVWIAAPARALDPEERLADPALEERARDISRELRCLVCKGQTIDESNAPIAKALRTLVRERLSAGDSDDEVVAAVTQRYGESVRLNPTFSAQSLALWFGPLLVLIAGGAAAMTFIRASARVEAAAPLTEEERATLRE